MTAVKIIHTGGTIGGVLTREGVKSAVCSGLTAHCLKKRPTASVFFDEARVFDKFSENIRLADMRRIAEAVNGAAREGCCGAIVTHGTDAAAYTAAFLSFVLSGLDMPVALVSANLPLSAPRTNGYDNFLSAVDFLLYRGVTRGVFVFYAQENVNYVHLGTRIQSAQAFTHRFTSAGGLYFGTVENGRFVRNRAKNNVTFADLREKRPFVFSEIDFSESVCYIPPIPNLNCGLYDFSKASAVLCGLYHSGTADSDAFCAIARGLIKNGTDVFACGADYNAPVYPSRARLEAAGVVFLPFTAEAAYIKLCLAYGRGVPPDCRAAFIRGDLAFETVGGLPRRVRVI